MFRMLDATALSTRPDASAPEFIPDASATPSTRPFTDYYTTNVLPSCSNDFMKDLHSRFHPNTNPAYVGNVPKSSDADPAVVKATSELRQQIGDDSVPNISGLQRERERELTMEKEKSIAGIVDRALLEVIENAFDILSANVKSWPPLEGLSADEGESALKDLVMGQCEKVVISKSSSPAHDDEIRMRAQQAIEERTKILRMSVSKKK